MKNVSWIIGNFNPMAFIYDWPDLMRVAIRSRAPATASFFSLFQIYTINAFKVDRINVNVHIHVEFRHDDILSVILQCGSTLTIEPR